MLNLMLIAICSFLTICLSQRWLEVTAGMQEESRQQRLSKHLNWQPATETVKSKKTGFFGR